LLIGLGAMGVRYIVPITVCIVVLLTIVFFSYRQTIEAYPNGGGSYTVAGQNLGPFAGLLAAAALMIDYVLTAAVGISAGVGALVSAMPKLEPRTLELCLAILLVITLINLRGVRETGAIFMLPTYFFVGTLLVTIAIGALKAIASGGHPSPVVAPPQLPAATAAIGAWLFLKSFASGCTAMTGVEAVSNGVQAFRKPVAKTARLTLTVIIALLIVLLLGIALLCRAYGIGATNPGPGYQSVLSQLTAAATGRGVFYYVTIASILLVLSLSANTAFADFPRLCRLAAEDCYLPTPFAVRGRRLVFTVGVVVLALLCAALLIAFGGATERLIPLYAVGAFLAFTLSQAGMVQHWRRTRTRGWRTAMSINAIGAFATACTVGIVVVTKFTEGAWITVIVIPSVILLMYSVRRHYDYVLRKISGYSPVEISHLHPPIVVVPIMTLNKVTRSAIEFGLNLSPDVEVVHVEDESAPDEKDLRSKWKEYVETPLQSVNLKPPRLKLLQSPYRFVIDPIVKHVLELERKHPGREIAVVIPELVEKHWLHYFLHNQRATWLKASLLLKGSRRIAVINVPWYIK
jgi:amino acid transporter